MVVLGNGISANNREFLPTLGGAASRGRGARCQGWGYPGRWQRMPDNVSSW